MFLWKPSNCSGSAPDVCLRNVIDGQRFLSPGKRRCLGCQRAVGKRAARAQEGSVSTLGQPVVNGVRRNSICSASPSFSALVRPSPLLSSGDWLEPPPTPVPGAPRWMLRSSRLSAESRGSYVSKDLPANPHTCGWSRGVASQPWLDIRMILGALKSTGSGIHP